MTQKTLIKKYLESLNGQWVRAYDLRGKSTSLGFLGHQADRRARELAQAGEIEHRVNGKYAEYRVAPKIELPNYAREIVMGTLTKFLDDRKIEEINKMQPFKEQKVESQAKLF